MVFDALRGYVQMANGLTDVTRTKAVQAARQVLDQGGELLSSGSVGKVATAPTEVARQVQSLAEDLIATSRTNRDLLVGLIRTEVERAIGRLGLVGADELAGMARVVERLQSQLDAAIAFGGRGVGVVHRSSGASDAAVVDEAGGAGTAEPAARTVRREPVTFASAGAVPVKKPAAKKVPVKRVPPKKRTATTAAARKPPVKRQAAKKVPVEPAPPVEPVTGEGPTTGIPAEAPE